jgi:hypothetical protein
VLLAACAHPPRSAAVPDCVLGDFPLVITIGEHEAAPGSVDTLRVSQYRGPFGLHDLPPHCSPVWSLAPGAPAELSPASGILRVAANAPDGATFALSARPLVGHWTEVTQTACGATVAETPAAPLRELVFGGDGHFSVTWMPFESYKDYWGTYQFDRQTGKLQLQVVGGNYVPNGLDLDGRALFEGTDEIRLSDLWLGSRTPPPGQVCASTFRRRGR